MTGPEAGRTGTEIAVVGMAARFPGARDVRQFWANLAGGVEGIRFFDDDELRAAGVDDATLADPNYVKARAVLDDIEQFDAGFFGLSPREAECTDPQHRFFLEVSHEALEHAGCDPSRFDGLIGVYGGVSRSMYLLRNLASNPDIIARMGGMQIGIGNDKDFVTTRVSYKLGLRGPSVNVQSACSTSLVAVHLACQGLLNRECDVALAGGATIGLPQVEGYHYLEGGVASPDGHCRAFDARAAGCIGGSGAGVVVLRRLEDALAAGDQIFAVLKGSAVNNDGADKMAYTAPSIRGQTEVIAEAQAVAGVEPDTVTFVEAHGTGTAVGDPIEVRALTQVFRESTARTQFCALGSVKTNIGHTDSAAGVAGLIKAVLAVHHRQIPPTLHFRSGHPECDLEHSPFFVNAELREWQADGVRRAGVSSFGIGGTNAHVVLEEAPATAPSTPTRRPQLLPLSARTDAALTALTARLADDLQEHPDRSLADVAATLQSGRQHHERRAFVVASDTAEAIAALGSPDPHVYRRGQRPPKTPALAFLFPGQGSQHVHMARDLDRGEPVFRAALDRCVEVLAPLIGADLRAILDPPEGNEDAASDQLRGTRLTQPSLFAVEYALAQLWMHWGVQPAALIGHSIGEYVAATLAGVFRVEDALRLVAARSRLMSRLPAGAMVAVVRPAAEIEPRLDGDLCLAAANEPSSCVVSGPEDQVRAWAKRMKADGIASRPLHTSHAFHSSMMDPILDAFTQEVDSVERRAPRIPFVSNLTGTWITEDQATDPAYWARHLREAVRFADGIATLVSRGPTVLLEVGPGKTLTTLAGRCLAGRPEAEHTRVVASLRHPSQEDRDDVSLRRALGELWLQGVRPDWSAVHDGERRCRVTLPAYPYQRRRHWIDEAPADAAPVRTSTLTRRPIGEWLYAPVWHESPLPEAGDVANALTAAADPTWLVLSEDPGIGVALVNRLRRAGARAVHVEPADAFARRSADDFAVSLDRAEDRRRLLDELAAGQVLPQRVLHLSSMDPTATTAVNRAGAHDPSSPDHAERERARRRFLATLGLVQDLERVRGGHAVRHVFVTCAAQDVTGGEALTVDTALWHGLARVLPQECPGVVTCEVDFDHDAAQRPEKLVERLLAEAQGGTAPPVAWRGNHRFVLTHQELPAGPATGGERSSALRVRDGGVYLITGGTGHVGQVVARTLAAAAPVTLVLTGRHAEQVPAPLADLENARVQVLRADVADAARMGEVVQQIVREHGALHGVVHAAGVVDGPSFQSLDDLEAGACQEQLHAKVDGLVALQQALAGVTPDFCLLISSLSSVLGGLGMAAYAAVNSFVDATARRAARQGPTLWRSVNLDAFQFGEDPGDGTGRTGLAALAMTAAEGQAILARVLALPDLPQVVVSTGDLELRWRRWVQLDAPAAEPRGATLASEPSPRDNDPDAEGGDPVAGAEEPEPAAELSETERGLAEIWSEVLGVPQVGPFDNFLDLGGHSLLMVQVSARIQEQFGVRVNPGENLFLTLTQLAALVEERLAPGAERASPAPPATGLKGKLGRLLRRAPPGSGAD